MTCWSKLPREVIEDLAQPWAAQQRKGSRAGRGSDLTDKRWGIARFIQQSRTLYKTEMMNQVWDQAWKSRHQVKVWVTGSLGMVELPCSLGRDRGQESHLESISREKVLPMRLLTVLVQGWTAAQPGAQAVKSLGNGGGFTQPLIPLWF